MKKNRTTPEAGPTLHNEISLAKRQSRARGYDLVSAEKTRRRGCNRCYYFDPRFMSTLEFHHLDPSTKVANVSRLVHDQVALDKVKIEMGKCELLCANCHRLETRCTQPVVRR